MTSFQKDLGLVSAEIETLQSRSAAMNTRLENRKTVEKLLGPAVEEISISPAVIRTISEEPIDEKWLKALSELDKKFDLINGKFKEPATIKAVTDIKPLLDDLTNKVSGFSVLNVSISRHDAQWYQAMERIRDFLVSQIKALRSPGINAQVIQQQTLSKYKDVYGFLAKKHPKLAKEIGQAYINTMRWYYLNHFSRYRQALSKVSIHHVDRHDVLGGDQSNQKSSLFPVLYL